MVYMVCPNSWIDGEIWSFIAVRSESTCLHYCTVRPDNGISPSAALRFLVTNFSARAVSRAGISACIFRSALTSVHGPNSSTGRYGSMHRSMITCLTRLRFMRINDSLLVIITVRFALSGLCLLWPHV